MTGDMLEATREYTKKGWVVHPLSNSKDNGKSPGKKPLLTNWQNLEKTPDDIGAYIKKGCNIGLVCGKASNIDAFDLDSDIFADELFTGIEINTLISGHRPGRGHILFRHENELIAERCHFIGIEYFGNSKEGNGSNLVLPPSIHHNGEVYKWKNPDAPLIKLPKTIKENWIKLRDRHNKLHEYFKKYRHCFTKGVRNMIRQM